MTEPEKIIVDIIKTRLNLPDSYGTYQGNIIPTIVIGNQNALLGNTDKLQIIVQSINDNPISSNMYYTSDDTDLIETTENIIFSTMQPDIQSRNSDARTRRNEILSALNSTYSQQVQEKETCRIFGVPISFTNNGNIQGGSALNRWTIRFKMTYKHTQSRSVDYYDQFPENTITENSSTSFIITNS